MLKLRLLLLTLSAALLLACFPCTVSAAEDPRFDGKTLEEIVDDFMKSNYVTYVDLAFGYYNTVTGESYYYNGDKLTNAASLYKVPLNMYFGELIAKGEYSFDTVVNGHTYEEIQYLSIEHSNNDLSEAMQEEIGTYGEYRTALLPLLGETPETVDPAYFRNNFFTPKQLIHCLKLLYEDPDRYPNVLEHMINQDHMRILSLKETRYQMANKYGFLFYENNGVEYEVDNEMAIVYTDDPFLMVVMSRNVSGTAGTLSKLCTLFCDYTNYCRGIRLEQEAAEREAAELLIEEREAAARIQAASEQLAAEEAAIQQLLEQEQTSKTEAAQTVPPTVPAEETAPEKVIPVWLFLLILPLVAAFCFLLRKKHRTCSVPNPEAEEASAPEPTKPNEKESRPVKLRLLILAVLFSLLTLASAAGTVYLCTYAAKAQPQIMESAITPEDTVNAYFSHLCAGEFAEADSYLAAEVMTLDAAPDGEVGALLYNAMWENFSYSCAAPAAVSGLKATQTVTVTYLDIPALTALQRTHMRAALEQLAKGSENPDALLDEEGYYNTEISLQALSIVTARLLEDPSRFLVTEDLTLELQYQNSEWKIISNDALYTALSGNTY